MNDALPGSLFTKELSDRLIVEMNKTIVGQMDAKEHLIIALITGGHVLLEGVPGTAKTLLAKTLAKAIHGEFKRIQFTPDLMPSDVIGTNVFDASTARFVLKKGPIFTHVALIDEVNRAPAKTQAALLEVMEERQITIDGTGYPLEEPFIVFATQNPIEYEGTYALPEAQLDRFMFKILIGYPSPEEEQRILARYHEGTDLHDIAKANILSVADGEAIRKSRIEVQKVKVEEGVLGYIGQVIRKTRDAAGILVGASPRAAVALLLASKTLAALRGRDYVSPDDVKTIARPVLRHRLVLQPETELEGLRADEVITSLLSQIPVPR